MKTTQQMLNSARRYNTKKIITRDMVYEDIEIDTHLGKQLVKGYRYFDAHLAITPANLKNDEVGWRITHIPTGKSLNTYISLRLSYAAALYDYLLAMDIAWACMQPITTVVRPFLQEFNMLVASLRYGDTYNNDI
jgi:hypothetical protein